MSRTEALKTRLDEYNTLLGLLNDKPKEIAPDGQAMIYIGDGYFTQVGLDHALEFVQSRVASLESQYHSILYSEGINEEGLPIMDIHEELDEDGNILNSSVERTGGSAHQIKKALSGMRHAQQDNQSNQTSRITETSSDQHNPKAKQSGEQGELCGDIKVDQESSSIEPAVQIIAEEIAGSETANETPNENTERSSNFHGISRDDMLELQVLGDELEDMQVKLNEDELIENFDEDYEMEYDEDASEESDEDEFGRSRGSLFPTDPRTAALLESHLNQKKKSSKCDKSVSFAPSLEVKEFETTSAERKGQIDDPESEQSQPPVPHNSAVDISSELEEPKKPKASLFRQRMCERGFTHQRKTERPATSDIIENLNVSSSSAPVKERVLERPTTVPAPHLPAQPARSALPSSSISDRPASGPGSYYSRKYAPPQGKVNARLVAIPATNAPVPPEFVQYVNDPDEVQLKDLESDALQYFNEATIPDEDFLALHDEPELNVGDTASGDDGADDRPVASQIVERMPEHKPDTQDSDMSEIRNEYQKLRQKLVYKAGGFKNTDKDQAVQELDENGNPVKVSRFRAARTSMR